MKKKKSRVVKPNNRIKTSKLKKESEIVWAFSAPETGRSIRVPSTIATVPTAVANMSEDIVPIWNTGTSSENNCLPSTDMLIALTREPACATIVYNGAAQPWSYDMYGLDSDDKYTSDGVFITGDGGPLNYQYGIPTADIPYHPHGSMWFAGNHPSYSEFKWFFIPGGSSALFTYTGIADVTGAFTISAHKYIGNQGVHLGYLTSGGVEYDGTTPVTTTLDFEELTPGYYAFYINESGSSTPGTTVSCVISGGSSETPLDIFEHHPLPDYETNYKFVDGIRINAASIHTADRAATQYNEGTIVQLQVGPRKHWLGYVAEAGATPIVNVLAKKLSKEASNLKKGAYTSMKLVTEKDLDMKDTITAEDDILTDSAWDITLPNGCMMHALYCSNNTGKDIWFETNFMIEFETQNKWFDVKSPGISKETFDKAMMIFSQTEQYHENPLHISDIWNGIKTGVSKAIGFARDVGSVAEIAAPFFA